MTLDDTQRCAAQQDNGRLIGLCVNCECRLRAGPATMQPQAREDERGEWSCCERRYVAHPQRLGPVALDGPPSSAGGNLTAVLNRGGKR